VLHYVCCRSDANFAGLGQSYMGRRCRVGHPFRVRLPCSSSFKSTRYFEPRISDLGQQPWPSRGATDASKLRARAPNPAKAGLIFADDLGVRKPWTRILGDARRSPSEPGHVVPAVAPQAVAITPTAGLCIATCGTEAHIRPGHHRDGRRLFKQRWPFPRSNERPQLGRPVERSPVDTDLHHSIRR